MRLQKKKRVEEMVGYVYKNWKFNLEDWGMILPPSINEKKRRDCEVLVKVTIEEI